MLTNKQKLKIINALLGEDKVKSGSVCLFIPLDKSTGIKLYSDKSDRAYSYNRQKKAAEIKIGPEVGDKFELTVPCMATYSLNNTKKFYGFFTQRAQDVGRLNPTEKLEKGMTLLGFRTYDLHRQNIGRIGKRVVCIDFGYEST